MSFFFSIFCFTRSSVASLLLLSSFVFFVTHFPLRILSLKDQQHRKPKKKHFYPCCDACVYACVCVCFTANFSFFFLRRLHGAGVLAVLESWNKVLLLIYILAIIFSIFFFFIHSLLVDKEKTATLAYMSLSVRILRLFLVAHFLILPLVFSLFSSCFIHCRSFFFLYGTSRTCDVALR